MAAWFNISSNHKLRGGGLKSKGNNAILYPHKLDHLYILIQLFTKKLSGEVEDHALIGSKWYKQEIQSITTLIFKM